MDFFTVSSPLPENRFEMRFLWAYLLVVIVFAFGFIGGPCSRSECCRPPGAERCGPNMSNFYQE